MSLLVVRFSTTPVHRHRLDLTKDLLTEVFLHIEQVRTCFSQSAMVAVQRFQFPIVPRRIYNSGLAVQTKVTEKLQHLTRGITYKLSLDLSQILTRFFNLTGLRDCRGEKPGPSR